MKFNLSTTLILFSLLTFISPAFAEDTSAKPEPKLFRTFRTTQEGAIQFPYPKPSEALWGMPYCTGSYTPNPEIAKAYEAKHKDARDLSSPTAFDVCFVPVREGSGLRLSGSIIAYDYDGKFISRDIFTKSLSSGEVFTKRIFAAGRYYEFSMKFFY